jgi:type IV pilus assembly protein PilM
LASLVGQIKDLIGNLTSLGAKEVIGLDIGAHAIKLAVVDYSGKGKLKITNFAKIPLGEAVIIEDEIQKIDEVVDAIKAGVRMSGSKTKAVCLGVYGPNTMTKRMQVPDGSNEEIEDHIIWESEQYVPFGVDDSELVHQVIGENDGGGFDAIMAAARSDMIEGFMDLVKSADLTVRLVDLNVFSINNYFEALYFDELEDISDEGAIIIDYGAQYTRVVVYQRGGPVITKEINIGGVLVTEEIQRQMGVSYEEAEDLKINGDESGNLPEEFLGIIEHYLEQLNDEIRKTVNYYIQQGTDKVSQCFITGGASLLPGVEDSLKAMTNCEIIRMDPLSKFSIDKKAISEELFDDITYTGAIAIGLSLRASP